MKCEECLLSIEDYIDEELEFRQAGAMIAHLAACRSCAGVYEQLLQEKQLYANYRRQIEMPLLAWSAVRARIAHEKTSGDVPFLSRLREWASAGQMAAGVCALLCVAVLIGLYAFGDVSHPPAKPTSQADDRRAVLPAGGQVPAEYAAADEPAVDPKENQIEFAAPKEEAGSSSPRAVELTTTASASMVKQIIEAEVAVRPLQEIGRLAAPGDLMAGASTPFEVALARRELMSNTPALTRALSPPTAENNASVTPHVAERRDSSNQTPAAAAPGLANALFEAQTSRRPESASRFEAGLQLSSLYFRGSTSPGIGTRFTYHLSDFVSLEAEGNFFPENLLGSNRKRQLGNSAQALFGAKIGRRWKKIGVFAKLRPGVMSLRAKAREENSGATGNAFNDANEGELRVGVHPVVDVGGVVEIYSSRRVVTRFDFGDTIVYNRGSAKSFAAVGVTKHNFQLGTGISLRF